MSGKRSYDKDRFADGPVLAAARTIPSWSHVDIHPSVPSTVRKDVNELRQDCEQELEEFCYNCGSRSTNFRYDCLVDICLNFAGYIVDPHNVEISILLNNVRLVCCARGNDLFKSERFTE